MISSAICALLLQMLHVASWTVYLLVTLVNLVMPFVIVRQTHVGQRNHVLDGIHGRHLASMSEQSVLGGNAGCYYHYCGNLFYASMF